MISAKFITTTKGPIDESLLTKKEGLVDNENEYTTWVEYRLKGEIVHRSAHVRLKKMLNFNLSAGSLSPCHGVGLSGIQSQSEMGGFNG